MIENKPSLRSLISKEQIQIPGIYDCISARAVELVGYKAAYLSSAGIAYSWAGVPDMGIINAEEMFWIASRVTDYIPLPLMVNLESGYSKNPLSIFRQVQRLIKCGVSAFIIDDTNGIEGIDSAAIELADEKEWLAKIKAAKSACESTECMVIARTWAKDKLGLYNAISRCAAAEMLGADMTSITGLKSLDEAQRVSSLIRGNKMWTNLGIANGVSQVEPADIDKLGYKLITIHYTEKGAMFGMLDFAKENEKNGNTVYHDNHDYDGMLKGSDYHELFSFHKTWIPLEDSFMDVLDIANSPNVTKGGTQNE